MRAPFYTDDAYQCAKNVIEQIGHRIVVATPLGIGKPVQFLNELYKIACLNPSIDLTILTALTLLKPVIKNDLLKGLLHPFIERVYGDYEDLLYEKDRRDRCLPKNIKIVEFFLSAGAYLNNPCAQRDYVSLNFTHVVKNTEHYGINVIASMVAKEGNNPNLSLSCNIDVVGDLIKNRKNDTYLVGQVNENLPYMVGSQAEINKHNFDYILENKKYNKKLFSVPKEMLTDEEFSLGLRVSSLIKDDGCLQVGIGSLNDAVVHGLILRHNHNKKYKEILKCFGVNTVEDTLFKKGLFGSTELLVDGYLELYKNGILKKMVKSEDGSFLTHAGFFIGSNAFYEQLKNMPKEARALFSMRSIAEINQLYGNETLKREQRKNARFVNTCLQVTLLGDVVSDSLEDGKTVSGVGGQYNFVAMAHELFGARSIIMCRSVRRLNKKIISNIVFNAPSVTIPRHLRDVVVTEYGIADIKGKTDEEVIKAMLAIADSRFQAELLKNAKSIGKIAADYEIPEEYRNNFPSTLIQMMKPYRQQGYFKDFVFGSEFNEEEILLLKTLKKLAEKNKKEQLFLLLKGLFIRKSNNVCNFLKPLHLYHPKTFKEYYYRALVLGALSANSEN